MFNTYVCGVARGGGGGGRGEDGTTFVGDGGGGSFMASHFLVTLPSSPHRHYHHHQDTLKPPVTAADLGLLFKTTTRTQKKMNHRSSPKGEKGGLGNYLQLRKMIPLTKVSLLGTFF